MRSVDATLYVIPGSYPSRTAAAMLGRKGIACKRVDAPPILPPAWLAGLRAEQAAPAR
jgi:hypothetical protein